MGDVSWLDAQEYVAWLSEITGATYRLPTEAEWEYAARAGTDTRYPWGDAFAEDKAVCLTCASGHGADATVGTVEPNAFGLYDMIGLQRELVEDCWQNGFEGAPADGSAYTKEGCRYRVTRGGAWYDGAKFLRSSARTPITPDERTELGGFRVVREE